MIYRKRKGSFDKSDWEWRITEEAFVEITPGGSERRLPWSEVSEIRLVFSPTQAKPWRHYFQLHGRSGGLPFEIDNTGCSGFENFQDLSRDYSPFVRAALERIRALAPSARVTAGLKPAVYAAGLAAMITASALLTHAVIRLPLEWESAALKIFVKVMMVGIALPSFILWGIQTRPRILPLDARLEKELPA